MATGLKGSWGGKRTGAGAKPQRPVTEKQIKGVIRRIRKRAKLEGRALVDVLLDVAYAETSKNTERISAIKALYEIILPKHKDVNVMHVKLDINARVRFPPLKPDPAKLVPIK